ncbi:hypothetical protein [Streptomyces hokutonensis]|uniref:hypothetical protein n=1 Tax=Streptomyces hokutonensis TaxID=1306990 RepID=UPI0033EBE78D
MLTEPAAGRGRARATVRAGAADAYPACHAVTDHGQGRHRHQSDRGGPQEQAGPPGAAQQVGGTGLKGAVVELLRREQRGGRSARALLQDARGAQGGGRVRCVRRFQQVLDGVEGQAVDGTQQEGGSGRGRGGGQPLRQGEFVRAARTREQPQPQDQGQPGP